MCAYTCGYVGPEVFKSDTALFVIRVLSFGIHLAERHAGIHENIMGINQTRKRINKLGNEIS